MLFLEDIKILPRYPDKIHVEWDVSNPSTGKDLLFNVFISDSPDGQFNKINIVPIVNKTFYDFDFPILSKEEFFYIMVKGYIGDEKEVIQGNVYPTFTVKLPRHIWLASKEIIRKKNLKREKFTGISCVLLKKKIIGKNCIECQDRATGQIINTRCDNCFGTRIEGGFLNPIEVIVEIAESARDSKQTEIGTIENLRANALITYPLVFKGDILVESDRNRRWYINGVERETLQTYVLDQTAEIRQIPPKDIQYKIPVNLN